MPNNAEEKLIPFEDVFLEAEISQQFLTHLNLSNDAKEEENEALDNHSSDDEDEEEEEEEEEFTFSCGGANASPISADDIFIDGQIRPVFPLFNRDLFFSGDDLPVRPPVKKVFVETSEETGPMDRTAVEVLPPSSPETCKKSNSTGFSKIWRLKDLVGRSNSHGRDTFVFMNNGHAPPRSEQPVAKGDGKKGMKEKVKGKKVKMASSSAHEAYLKSKAAKEERRRSYLPYRPELMGFFTNVNGGLSKNVHPF